MFLKKSYIFICFFTSLNALFFFWGLTHYNFLSNYCLLTEITDSYSFSHDSNDKLRDLKVKLHNDVIDMEKERSLYVTEIYSRKIELSKLQNEVYQLSLKSYRTKQSIISLQQIRRDYERRHKNIFVMKPIVSKFTYITNVTEIMLKLPNKNIVSTAHCSMFTCFNLEACTGENNKGFKFNVHGFPKNFKEDWIKESIFYSNSKACATFIFPSQHPESCEEHNCVIFGFRRASKSVIVSSDFNATDFRSEYDIISPAIADNNAIKESELEPLFPLRRRFLLSFSTSTSKLTSELDRAVLEQLVGVSNEMMRETGNSEFHLELDCVPDHSQDMKPRQTAVSYPLCGNRQSRLKTLRRSRYCLVLSSWLDGVRSTGDDQQRLLECLEAGSVPLVLGGLVLPFSELVDWRRAAIQLPKQWFRDLLPLLQTVLDEDLFQMRLYGRSVLLTYMRDPSCCLNSVSLILSSRLALPLPRVRLHPTALIYHNTSMNTYNFSLPNFQVDIDPYLGPNTIEATDSPSFSSPHIRSRVHPGSQLLLPLPLLFHRYPSTPWDPVLSSDAALRGHPSRGFYAINHTVNEAGTEFQQSLGGNAAFEQFTIVILAYRRPVLLRKSIEVLRGLPYLHSVVVVWNDAQKPPGPDFRWPAIHVPIKVVEVNKSSLNNRFVPYDVIRTDAVLSFDDDIQLRHDEIVFAFRVWRENRDRIVGFPARYHSEQSGPPRLRYPRSEWWLYNSNYTCEYSMVLTGAAFLHRFYLFAYTNDMQPEVRAMVDKYNNCEDIAMNFLVSHISRKPPLKVTVRWTLSCINCDSPSSSSSGQGQQPLHTRADHYASRSHCINLLSRLYGYNPLLYSQFRVDSVLFKTRLPQDKQKCFRYI